MFVGHGTLAFAFVAFVATVYGVSRERALALGVAAGLFAFVPDADMVYALTGLLHVDEASTFAAANAFWATSTAVHRSITHSLLIAVPMTIGLTLLSVTQYYLKAVSVGVFAVLISLVLAKNGSLGIFVTVTFLLAGMVGVYVARNHLGLGTRDIGMVAFVGIASHPFGDLLTGEPPAFLYPLEVTVVETRPAPFVDGTLNLLTAFGFELIAIWAGVLVYLSLTNRRFFTHLAPQAAMGATYALTAFVIQPPTLETSYQFVFTVLAVGSLGVHPRSVINRSYQDAVTMVVTGLSAVTVAGLGYTISYVFTASG